MEEVPLFVYLKKVLRISRLGRGREKKRISRQLSIKPEVGILLSIRDPTWFHRRHEIQRPGNRKIFMSCIYAITMQSLYLNNSSRQIWIHSPTSYPQKSVREILLNISHCWEKSPKKVRLFTQRCKIFICTEGMRKRRAEICSSIGYN